MSYWTINFSVSGPGGSPSNTAQNPQLVDGINSQGNETLYAASLQSSTLYVPWTWSVSNNTVGTNLYPAGNVFTNIMPFVGVSGNVEKAFCCTVFDFAGTAVCMLELIENTAASPQKWQSQGAFYPSVYTHEEANQTIGPVATGLILPIGTSDGSPALFQPFAQFNESVPLNRTVIWSGQVLDPSLFPYPQPNGYSFFCGPAYTASLPFWTLGGVSYTLDYLYGVFTP